MGHEVIKVNTKQMNEMLTHYKQSVSEKTPQGAVFSAKLKTCTVTAYKSGKVLFQGKEASEEAAKWNGVKIEKKPASSVKKQHSYSPPHDIAQRSIIGSDEVGTGDYFGPMTVVSAFVASSKIPLLKELGVKDSKHLTDPQIVSIAEEIIQVIPYSLLILHNQKYNELQKQGMNQGKMKAMLHNQAINHLINKLDGKGFDGILIDQFAEPNSYFNYLKGEATVEKTNVYFSTKAEGVHLSVAAASIIARYAFIKEMDILSEKVGFPIPKGAGNHVDEAAAKLILKQGEEALWNVTKHHFANTDKAKKIVSMKK